VHATGQVISFDLDWAHGEAALLRALNATLPWSVAAKDLGETAPDFHPRYAAKSRRYRYTVYNAQVRSPLVARYCWHVAQPELSLTALNTASARLAGRRDFAAFGTSPEPDGHTVRTVFEAGWKRSGEVWTFDIEADAYLFRMVRSIVGTLRQVGAGEMTPEEFVEIIESADRSRSAPPAPPNGLCLVEVKY
jgi:tRNA pseudouridine38-40 synthase